MLRYRFKWNRYYGFDLFYGKEVSLCIPLWVYKYHPNYDFAWTKTNIMRELTRRFARFDYGGYPKIYFDWQINDMIREYENHKERDE